MQHILEHLQEHDPTLYTVALKIGKIPSLTKKGNTSDHFTELCASIISQQLSVKVADVIWGRFLALHKKFRKAIFRHPGDARGAQDDSIQPDVLLSIPDQTIRDIGVSWAKIAYIKDLAHKVIDHEIDLETIDTVSDEAVIVELVKVKGIGRWTAEMFLMFSLARPDVFSTGDLGLKRAIQRIYALQEEPNEEKLLALSAKWSPYRTYACRILWKPLDQVM